MASAFVERFSAPRRTGNFILDLHPLVKLNVMISLCALNFLFDSPSLRTVAFQSI